MIKKKILVICGPTATGKSDLAVRFAKKFNGEIISADSRQVYKGMDLGTGKIKEDEMFGIKHYLLDVADPKVYFSAAEFKELADQKIEEILKKGKLPIICGGTGFYISALIDNFIMPEVKADWDLRNKFEKESLENLQKDLIEKDLPRWERMNESDRQNKRRLIRALEIIELTGEQTPELIKGTKFDVLMIGITAKYLFLKSRIEKRLIKRLEEGMINEVKKLNKEGVSWEKMDDFGLEYRWLAKYLQDKISYEEMIIRLTSDIYNFARRQMTWFRKDKRVNWFDIEADAWDNEVENLVNNFANKNA